MDIFSEPQEATVHIFALAVMRKLTEILNLYKIC